MAKPSDLTPEALAGFAGGSNPYLYSSPSFYAFALGAYLCESALVSRPSGPVDVRMGRGDSIRANGMRFAFKAVTLGKAVVGIKFERVE